MKRRWSARGRRETRLEGLVLVVDSGAVVGDAHHPAGVEDGDHDVAKAGVDEVLDELVDDREGHVAALVAARVVGPLGKRGDQVGHVALLDAHDARRARQRVVDGDARRAGALRGVGGARLGSGGGAGAALGGRLVDRRGPAGDGGTRGARGRRILGQQPVEERLHGGMEYSRDGSPPAAAVKSAFAGDRPPLSTGFSTSVESPGSRRPRRAQIPAFVEKVLSGLLVAGPPVGRPAGRSPAGHRLPLPLRATDAYPCKSPYSAVDAIPGGMSSPLVGVNGLCTLRSSL